MPPRRLDGMKLLALAMRGGPCRSTAFRLLRFRCVTGRGDRSRPAPLLRGARRGGGFGRHGRYGCGGDDENGRGGDEGRKLQADPPERPGSNLPGSAPDSMPRRRTAPLDSAMFDRGVRPFERNGPISAASQPRTAQGRSRCRARARRCARDPRSGTACPGTGGRRWRAAPPRRRSRTSGSPARAAPTRPR